MTVVSKVTGRVDAGRPFPHAAPQPKKGGKRGCDRMMSGAKNLSGFPPVTPADVVVAVVSLSSY